jgi:glutamine synthetase
VDADTRERQRLQARQEAARLTAEGVRAVALGWVDNAGVSRVKTIPTTRLANAAHHGIGASPVFDVFTSEDAVTSSPHSGGPDGDLRLFPDLDRLAVLAAQPGWAWAPADRYDQQGGPHPGCQRLFARRMAERAAAAGLDLRMGFETEWIVDPAGDGPAYGLTRVVERSDYLRDLYDALAAQRLEVLQIHPEYTPGQFEVSTAPADPVRAADDVVLVRETVRAVSLRHGLRASFAPSFTAGHVGNGCHLHLSAAGLLSGGDGPYGITAAGEAFLAGVLGELPALLAVGAPSPASYLRLEPSRWAGVYRCWGLENREAALRFIADEANPNAELKPFDAAANPYLLVGAVIAAGLAGSGVLPPPVAGDPAGRGGQERLPVSLTEAADRFEESAVLREALGEVLYGAVLAVRRAEAERFAKSEPQEIAEATRWRW